MKRLTAFAILLMGLTAVSCGPFTDKKDLREDPNQLPDSIGTPGFRPDTTIYKVDSPAMNTKPVDSVKKTI